MKINEAGLELIKSFEGLRLTAYKDVVGVLTIGFGHTGSDVYEGQQIDANEATELLMDDLCRFEAGVDDLLEVDVTDNQFSALVCFAYNVGLGNLGKSTLLKLVNIEDFGGAANEFQRWSRAGGKVMAGLLRRREAEKKLFLT